MRMREWEREGGIFNSFLHTINQRGNILSHLTPFIYTPQSKEEREGKREREKKEREKEREREKKEREKERERGRERERLRERKRKAILCTQFMRAQPT